MQASNQKLDRIESRIKSLENRSDKQPSDIETKESPYDFGALPNNKSPGHNSLKDDLAYNSNPRSRRKRKTKSKKKLVDLENNAELQNAVKLVFNENAEPT